jgi:hypothetical protein
MKKSLTVELRLEKNPIITFTDTANNGGPSTFERTIKSQKLIYVKGEIRLKTVEKFCKFLKPLIKKPFILEKFQVMDIETKDIELFNVSKYETIKTPYCMMVRKIRLFIY